MAPALLHQPEQDQSFAVQAIPRDRVRLAGILARLEAPAATAVELSALPAARVDIGEECYACSLCSRFCPTAALRSRTHGSTFELSFVPVYCVGCTICAVVCPAKCVALSGEVDAQGLARSEPQTLARLQVTPCSGCKTLCAPAEPDPLCFACRAREERRRRSRR